MAKEIPSTVFNQWKVYWQIEPFGSWRDNFNIATLTALTANVNRGKDQKPYSEKDFMYEDHQTRSERMDRESKARTQSFIQTLKSKAGK
jgi:tRNA/tmRNA/rRNA uracil-C5-methylase (TrmA/RlmC/RlmD family)